ncbi:permease, partial [Burkholderia cenocepacia]|uniref:permease n=1 Tax=Burkholderia cenocepacia TaxID=95486 RepID=UPI00223189AC
AVAHKHLGHCHQLWQPDVYERLAGPILLLLTMLIYVIAWLRASMNTERVRDYLVGKRRGLGYLLGASFGAATPFCSCSSIPLFLGFTTARIPIGITMSFLITSPLINEIAVVLLWGLLGWKFTLIYLAVGMGAGILGGFLMDSLKAERWLQPFVIDAMGKSPNAMQHTNGMGKAEKLSVRQRHDFAYAEMISIFKKVWKWVVIGVGIGAALHGFVPDNWFADNLGKV